MTGAAAEHPVAEALRQRPEGARIALVVEGGGMRGAVSGGMALGLDELGLGNAFDAAYGSSAGALNALWFLSGRIRDGMPTWTDPGLNRELISWKRMVGRDPIVNVRKLIDERYEQLSPGLFRSVLASPTTLHPLATDVDTGQPVDLGPRIADETSLRKAVRASATLPLLAGAPVEFEGARYLDAGLSAAIPFHAAFADGATHVLVLRSRREGEVVEPSSGMSGRATARALSRIHPEVARAFTERAEREMADEQLLAEHDRDPNRKPYVLSIRPAPGSVSPARLERDTGVIRSGLEAGRQSVHRVLAAP